MIFTFMSTSGGGVDSFSTSRPFVVLKIEPFDILRGVSLNEQRRYMPDTPM